MMATNRRFSILLGVVLIVLGGLTLAANLVGPLFGWGWWRWMPWRLWPLLVVSLGLLLVLSPFSTRGKPGLGGLFFPGMPILTTGTILLFASVFNAWDVWAWLWPLEVLSVAFSFLFAALYMRNTWLLIPAIIIGANGLLFQFCALTGWWGVWAVLWTIEPLSVGLALLAVNLKYRRKGLLIAGLILCGVAAFGLVLMTAVLPEWWVLNLLGPVLFIGVGLILLLANGRSRPALRESMPE